MLPALNQVRQALYIAILVAIGTSVVVPSANARRQSSPGETAKSTQSTPPSNTSSAKGTRSTVTHHSSSTSTHKKSSSARTARTSSANHSSARRSSRRSRAKRVRGQQKIDSERARSIQQALIREHYLTGEPTGAWDQASENAMRRYQSDQGWQTKEVPDSRALIKLGLGPNNDHLLNPDSAMTSTPIAQRSEAPAPAHASTASEPAASADAPPSAKPASLPQSTPAAQPATPPKDSENSAGPQ